ncbi:MAG: M23 family metallopeptidase, partial [Glaciecola sp.]|nr:M23 family metallopeptidase [Glaciecola sp.]
YTHHSKRVERTIDVRKWLSMLVLTTVLVLISSRSTHSVDENIQRVQLVKQGLLAQQEIVFTLQQESQLEVQSLVNELAKIEHKLMLLSMQQVQLAKNTNQQLNFFDVQVEPNNIIEIPEQSLNIQSKLTNLNDKLVQQINQLDALEKILNHTHIDEEQYVAGRPINKGWLSSYYGMRDDPFTQTPAMHKGIDFAGTEGDEVIATAAGIVTWSGERYGYGNLIEIDHGNGLVTRYGHNKELIVSVGEVVVKGQEIALIGNTGRSTGAHVHYEIIKNGTQIDPLPYVYRQ